MKTLKRVSLVCAVCVFGGRGACAQSWSAGEAVLINPGTAAVISTPQPDIHSITNNGGLTIAAGGSVSITGDAVSAVGAHGADAVMTIAGSVVKSGAGAFVVGHQGGTGTVTVASGGLLDIRGGGLLYLCGNNSSGERVPTTRGYLDIAGTAKLKELEFTPFFPNAAEAAYVVTISMRLSLLPPLALTVSTKSWWYSFMIKYSKAVPPLHSAGLPLTLGSFNPSKINFSL